MLADALHAPRLAAALSPSAAARRGIFYVNPIVSKGGDAVKN